MRVKPGDNMKWKHPPKPDLIDLHPASIVECHVEGEWGHIKPKNHDICTGKSHLHFIVN